MRCTLALIAAAVLLAACGGSGKAAAPATPTKPSESLLPPRASIYPGETAATIAGLIKGCTQIEPGALVNGAMSGMTSNASCTLNGRKIWVNSFKDAASADPAALLQDNKVETYYAMYSTWSVVSGDDPDLELQLTSDAAALLRNAGAEKPPADISGQKESMTVVADSLGGLIYHVRKDGTIE